MAHQRLDDARAELERLQREHVVIVTGAAETVRTSRVQLSAARSPVIDMELAAAGTLVELPPGTNRDTLKRARAELNQTEREQRAIVYRAKCAVIDSRRKLDAAEKRVRDIEFAVVEFEIDEARARASRLL